MDKRIYAIVLHPEKEGGFSVSVPDLGIGTQGETIHECLEMSRDAIGIWASCEQDAHRPIPEASTLTPLHEPDEIVELVEIDFSAFRRANL